MNPSVLPYSPLAVQPSQRKKDWTEEDYISNLRWLSSQYNRPIFDYGYSTTTGRAAVVPNWVQNYIANESYYQQRQAITPYGFFAVDETNKPTSTIMYQGSDIRELIDQVVGNLMQPLKTLPKMITAISVSPNAVTRKMILKDLAKLRVANKVYFDILEDISGVGFQPMGDLDFEDEAQIEQFFTTFRDDLEKAYIALAKDACYRNHWIEVFSKSALYYCIGGFAMMRHSVRNGKVWWDIVEPRNAIWDNFRSSDQHRYDRFAGEVRMMTIPELVTLYDFTEQEQKELETIAQSRDSWTTYNWVYGGYTFYWWNSDNKGVPVVATVEGQWRSLEFVNGEWIEVIREGVLIGNKYIKNYGISKNTPEERDDKSKLKFRYVTVTPSVLSGVNMSMIDVLKKYQDLKDAFKTKLIQLVARSKGKGYFVNANKLPEGMNTPEIISQLSQAGIAVLEGDLIDEGNNSKGTRLVEQIDMTLDPSILGLAQLIQQERNYMDNIISMPASARGVVTNYQSADQIMSNIQQSRAGLDYFYTSFYTWVLRNLELSADMMKNLIGTEEDDEEYTPLIVGDTMYEMLKMENIAEMPFTDFAMSLSIDDFANEQDKKMMQQVALQLATAGAITMADYTRLLSMTSKTEIANYFQYIDEKKKQEQMMMQQQQAEQAIQQQDMSRQTQLDSTAISADAGIQKELIKQDTELAKMDRNESLG
jgi:hypothetical protein